MNSVIAQLAPEGNFPSYICFKSGVVYFSHWVKLLIENSLGSINCELFKSLKPRWAPTK